MRHRHRKWAVSNTVEHPSIAASIDQIHGANCGTSHARVVQDRVTSAISHVKLHFAHRRIIEESLQDSSRVNVCVFFRDLALKEEVE